MNVLLRMRLSVVCALIFLLSGCASETIRGEFTYDLRPKDTRPEVTWPKPPDTARYLYLGELVGEPNFKRDDKAQSNLVIAFNWIVGLFETATPALLQRPQHGAVGNSGRIYVVDAGRSAVVVLDPNPPEDDTKSKEGHMLFWHWAGKNTSFSAPIALAIAWNGDIAVSDAKLGIVVRLNAKGEPVGKLGAGQLKRPTGLAFDPERGLLFVADTVAHDIKVFDGAGQLVNTFGAPGEGKGEFNAPTHLAFSGGHLYVTDTLNNRIQVFDSNGSWVREFGERGMQVGNLMRPKGIAVGEGGIAYVIESYFNHLLVYNEQGEFLLGINGSGLNGDNFLLPSGVWTDRQGRIFVADMFNGRIVMFQFIGDKTDAPETEGASKKNNLTEQPLKEPRS